MKVRRREDALRAERGVLAPFATFSDASPGRRVPEEPHPYRGCFQRDRDRIVHSRSFRRLEYKTQVFLNGAGDHYRTRLTHTIEVAAASRSLARIFGANEDLTEAVALAHDLGHPPFGHAGERTLHDLMHGAGGFDHNRQALRVVDMLEKKYPGFDGLNLTWDLRAGLIKARGRDDAAFLDGIPLGRSPSFEAQIADLADDLVYTCHDLDDGLEAGLIREPDIEAACSLWRRIREDVASTCPDLAAERRRAYMIRTLFDGLVENVVAHTARRLEAFDVRSAADVRALGEPLVGFADAAAGEVRELRHFLYRNLYGHPEIAAVNARATEILRNLFRHCLAHPEDMGAGSVTRLRREGAERVVCDYIAGMTDRYAFEEHARLCRPAGLRGRPDTAPPASDVPSDDAAEAG